MDDPVLSAAEADHAEMVRILELHQAGCQKRHTARGCSECHGLGRHVERTRLQMELLAAPGVTEELF